MLLLMGLLTLKFREITNPSRYIRDTWFVQGNPLLHTTIVSIIINAIVSSMTSQKQTNGTSSNYTVPLQINGAEITTHTTFDVIDPATESTVWKSSSASIEDVRNAAKAAEAAFPAWAKKKPSVRRDILLRAADILEKRTDELVGYMKLETAATDHTAHLNVTSAVAQLRQVASDTVAEAGFVPVCAEEGRSAIVIQEPYGVVLGIAPWYLVERPGF